jgi:hypothetical protein
MNVAFGQHRVAYGRVSGSAMRHFIPPALGIWFTRMRYSLMSVIAMPRRSRPTLVGPKPVDRNIRLRAAIPPHIPRFSY